MIYLTTGANGAGKTLLTLLDVREQQLKENRPVYFHGFEMDEAKQAEFGWKPFEPKDWQSLPDGSICIMDECQNEFPLRKSGAEVPDYINAIAQFRRKRGFDFWMITPHPMLLDVFIRRLIGEPSWHRHLKRAPAGSMVSVLKWNAVKVDCDKAGSGASGEISMRPYPKQVFSWYRSASLHTAKPRIPRAVWYIAAAAIAVPLLFGFAFSKLVTKKDVANEKDKPPADVPVVPLSRMVSAPAPAAVAAMSVDEYVRARAPRFPGMPFTAPVYDAVTAPLQAPYPAACLDGISPRTKRHECTCWTQQGTRLVTPKDMCTQIALNGFFMDWKPVAPQVPPPAGAGVVAAAPAPSAPIIIGGASKPLLGASEPVEVASGEQAVRDGANIGAIRANQRRLVTP